MNLRLKLFALLMTFLLLAAAPLVSCGQMQNAKQDAVGFDRMRSGERTEKSEPVTIKWASFALADEGAYPAYEAAAKGFMEANQTIKVELDGSHSYSAYLDNLLKNISSEAAPTVAHIRAEWLPALLETGAVHTVAGMDERILQAYTNVQLEAVSEGGVLYALPWYYSTQMLFYNKTLLDQVQVAPEEIQSFDDLLAAAKKVCALGDDIFGFALPSSGVMPGEGYHVLPVLWANGGDLLDAEGKIALDNTSGMQTYRQLQQIFEENISPQGMTSKELRTLFGEGKIGFLYDVQAGVADCAAAANTEEDFYRSLGYMEIPGGAGYIESHLLVVLNADNDAQLSAARFFLEYMSGDAAFYYLNAETPAYLPAREDVRNRALHDSDALTRAFADAADHAREIPYMRLDFVKADDDFSDGLLRVVGGEEVNTVLADMKRRMQAYLR